MNPIHSDLETVRRMRSQPFKSAATGAIFLVASCLGTGSADSGVPATNRAQDTSSERKIKDKGPSASEAVVFDWNEIITKLGRYIEGPTQWKPNNPPVRVNTDWTKPPHFANGTYHVRVVIRKMAKDDDFKFIFNHWQVVDGKHAEATMAPPHLAFQYRGMPITRTFEFPVQELSSVHTKISTFVPFDWSKPRNLVGFFPPAFPRSPESAKLDPVALPADIRFTVVVVAPGARFSGWDYY